MEWVKHPLTREVARAIRAANRVGRYEIEDHRFAYADLKELWASEDECHAVLTHDKDPIWQYWVNDGAWRQFSVHRTREDAQKEALVQTQEEPTSTPVPGIYLLARCGTDSRPIKVHCTSQEGPEALRSIFARLGYAVALENVA